MERALTMAVSLLHGDGPALLWAVALAGGVGYAVRSARQSGLDPRLAYWAAAFAIVAGLCGSRLLGMVVYGAPSSLGEVISGGHSYYGGLLAGAFAALAFFRLRGAPVLRHADAMTPAVALAYAAGRCGCFFNGDDYGVLTNGLFAVRYPPHTEAFVAQVQRGLLDANAALSLPVVPVQLLHAALGVALFALLAKAPARPGHRLALFAVGYGCGRFFLEMLRGEFSAAVGPLSLHQAISVGLVAAGVALLLRERASAGAAVEAQ